MKKALFLTAIAGLAMLPTTAASPAFATLKTSSATMNLPAASSERTPLGKKVLLSYATSDIYGSWTLNYSWGCTGTYVPVPMTFNSNGTFSVPSQSLSGIWSFVENTTVFKFNSPSNTTYTGLAYGGTMKGVSTTLSGLDGCWTATKTSTTTKQQRTFQNLSPAGEPLK